MRRHLSGVSGGIFFFRLTENPACDLIAPSEETS
jgi:hypothetical protein